MPSPSHLHIYLVFLVSKKNGFEMKGNNIFLPFSPLFALHHCTVAHSDFFILLKYQWHSREGNGEQARCIRGKDPFLLLFVNCKMTDIYEVYFNRFAIINRLSLWFSARDLLMCFTVIKQCQRNYEILFFCSWAAGLGYKGKRSAFLLLSLSGSLGVPRPIKIYVFMPRAYIPSYTHAMPTFTMKMHTDRKES